MRVLLFASVATLVLAACDRATDTAPPQGGASQTAAAPGPNCDAPPPTAVTVTGETTREGQLALLNGYHIDRAGEFIDEGYIQHNPMANTGLSGMQNFFRSLNIPPRDIPEAIPEGVISVVAEGDLVIITFPRGGTDACGRQFVTTWFDMFRIKDGLIVEHWDPATRP